MISTICKDPEDFGGGQQSQGIYSKYECNFTVSPKLEAKMPGKRTYVTPPCDLQFKRDKFASDRRFSVWNLNDS